MESKDGALTGKLKALGFMLSKTDDKVKKRRKTPLERHWETLRPMLNANQILKKEIEEAKFTSGESEENVGE